MIVIKYYGHLRAIAYLGNLHSLQLVTCMLMVVITNRPVLTYLCYRWINRTVADRRLISVSLSRTYNQQALLKIPRIQEASVHRTMLYSNKFH